MAARGYGRLKTRRDLDDAWAAAAGDMASRHTRVHGYRHGVLTVLVAHSALLEELVAYRKPQILDALRQSCPDMFFRDVRFRIGTIPPDTPQSRPSAGRP